MKKKRSISNVRFIIFALITAMLLTGCAETIGSRETAVISSVSEEQQTVSAAAETEISAETAAPEEAPPEQNTTTTEPEPEPESQPEPEPEPDPTAEVYAAAKHVAGLRLDPSSKNGVYRIKGLLEKEPDIEYHNGIVAAFEYVKADEKEKKDGLGLALENYTIRLYDMRRSLLIGETDSITTGYFPYNWETCGSFDGGYYSCFGNKLRIMDIGMNVRREFELPAGSVTQVWVTDSGRFILCNSRRGPTVLFDAENQSEITLTQTVKAESVVSRSNDMFDIVTSKGERFRIMSTGTVIPFGTINVPDYYYESFDVLGGRVIDLTPAGLCIRRPDLGTGKLIDYPTDKISYIISATTRYLSFAGDDEKTRVIDLYAGRISEVIGKGDYATRGSDRDGSFIFTNGKSFFLAVPSELNFKKSAKLTEIDLKKDEYLLYFKQPVPDSESSSKLLDELLEKYNVRVMFAPVSEDRRYCGYYCKAYNGSQAQIIKGLRDFLALSPPEILTEAAKGGSETWILICGSIVDDPELSSFGTAGFTAELGLHPFVALETPLDENQAKSATYMTENELYKQFTTFITNNFSHEFIHILDGRTTEIQRDEWEKLSPENAYYGSYNSSSDDESYLHYFDEFDDSVYFTDKYGRVNDLEDKARIGENLYYARNDSGKASKKKFACSRSLYNKAVKLCEMFRENYPCLAEIPQGEWYLEKPLLGSYEEMKEAYIKDKNAGKY